MNAPSTASRRRIVVGVDGSESSIEALRWADRLSAIVDAEIDAVLTWQLPVSYGEATGLSDWNPGTDAVQILATAIKSAFDGATPAGLRSTIVEGHPARVLVEASTDAEMLVVGCRGHGGFVGLLIGSVSSYCAEHANCAVLVVHDKN